MKTATAAAVNNRQQFSAGVGVVKTLAEDNADDDDKTVAFGFVCDWGGFC